MPGSSAKLSAGNGFGDVEKGEETKPAAAFSDAIAIYMLSTF